MQYAVITGISRGLGEAVAKQFIEKGVNIIGVSRSENDQLNASAEDAGVRYSHVSCDLSDPEQLEEGLKAISSYVFEETTEYVYLINNAGVVEPIDTVGRLNPETVTKHMQVNVTAPILLVNHLLPIANKHHIPMGIINITSGAAEKTIHGWSTYSSSKAAINRFTETLALEQKEQEHLILAYSPGVMDTEMQEDIRSSSEEAFADVEKFRKLKEEGSLRSPEKVAEVLMDLISKPEQIENGKVYKLYDLVKD
ncbi:(S)-benzoin forming benzil reductase [Halobacillus litoralis]|uniref:(S)-benzoin forming benzil reductase n=1 Tax=Halobacillus litoralis TaxID=45668 RepID=UPI001CFE96F6|nr:(S)-benzoin forming benzil reductase [Halobacillus litoralis]